MSTEYPEIVGRKTIVQDGKEFEIMKALYVTRFSMGQREIGVQLSLDNDFIQLNYRQARQLMKTLQDVFC